MNTAEALDIATSVADSMSEHLTSVPGSRFSGTVSIALETTGVILPAGVAVVQHLGQLLATPYSAQRPNDFQWKLEVRPSVAIVLSAAPGQVSLRLWTEVLDQGPWLGFELVAAGGAGSAIGGFAL